MIDEQTGPVREPEKAVQEKLERTVCPACGSERHRLLLRAPDRFNPDQGRPYQIVACSVCAFVYLNPRPKRAYIGGFYVEDGYQPHLSLRGQGGLLDRVYAAVRQYMLGWKRRKIERFVARGRLLDIGCGTGEFLGEMQRHGWDVEGLERDASAAEYATRTFGVPVTAEDFLSAEHGRDNFHVVTLWHALEHLYEPLNVLRKVRDVLRRDGLVLVAAPNLRSLDGRFYGPHWVALDAPRHVQHFHRESMAQLCEASGLELFEWRQMPFDVFYNCLLSERLAARGRRGLDLLPFLLRGMVVAAVSWVCGSWVLPRRYRNGSSMLYFIKPAKH